MSAFLKGFLIVLFVIVVNTISAFLVGFFTGTQTPPTQQLSGCSTNGNFTTCQNTSTGSFLASVFKTVVTGFDGAWPFFNVLWILANGGLLIAGILMMVARWVPFLGGES